MISEEEAAKIQEALTVAIAAEDWDAANKCADLLNKVRTMSTPLAAPAGKWLATQAALPIKAHPTAEDADAVRSDVIPNRGDYL